MPRTLDLALAATVAMAIGMALTPIRAEEDAELKRRHDCVGHLKSLGLALRLFASDHGERFPDALWVLARDKYMTPLDVYTCPGSDTKPATSLQELQTGPHCDYRYFGAGLRQNPGLTTRTIVACDRPGNHPRHTNVVFCDGQVMGYEGDSIAEIADRHNLLLPDHSLPRVARLLDLRLMGSICPNGWHMTGPELVSAPRGYTNEAGGPLDRGIKLIYTGPRYAKSGERIPTDREEESFSVWIMPPEYSLAGKMDTAPDLALLGSSPNWRVYTLVHTNSTSTWATWPEALRQALQLTHVRVR